MSDRGGDQWGCTQIETPIIKPAPIDDDDDNDEQGRGSRLDRNDSDLLRSPSEAGWALEVKWDGIRAQLRYDGRRVCVRSRPRRDCTAEFPELTAIADALVGRHVILDGELVCFDHAGKPDFALSGRGAAGDPATAPRALRPHC